MGFYLFHDDPMTERWRFRFWILAVLLLATGFIVTAWSLCFRVSAAATQNKQSESQAAEPPTPDVVCLGVVDYEDGVLSLHIGVPGRVVEVPAENAVVRSGAVLLRIDDESARASVREAEASLDAAEASYVETQKKPRQHELLLSQQRDAVAAARHELAAAAAGGST